MPALEDILSSRLQALQTQQLRRQMAETAGNGVYVTRQGRELVSFSSNDYLGLAHDARVITAGQSALAEYGAGGGASRLITGNHPLYAPLETALANAKDHDAALVFGSGYLANLGVLTALMEEGDLILLDKLSHACLIDGARLSGARWMRFKHNNTDDLARLLAKHRGEYRHCLIVTETVFSMDGDRAPLVALRTIADQHDAWLMADDAHGLFSCPSRGDGRGAEANILTGTLSKALGSYGGYVCASRMVIDYLTTAARSLLFTTSLPPATIAAAQAALAVAHSEPERAERALSHARCFCAALGLPQPESQIVPILLGEAEAALRASETLDAQGILVSAIRPPTVPQGTARLRISFSSSHTELQLEKLIRACSFLSR